MKITTSPGLIRQRKFKSIHKADWIAILGNPNSGKTALFNRLTGLHHKVGNYPGVTVEEKSGWLKDRQLLLKDLPGTYSLNAGSLDEQIVARIIRSWHQPENRPRAALVVLDATNLERNIFLALQVLETGIPTILVLNMMDEARKNGLSFNAEKMRQMLQAHAVIPASAKLGEGIDEIVRCLTELNGRPKMLLKKPRLTASAGELGLLKELAGQLEPWRQKLVFPPEVEAMRLLANDDYLQTFREFLPPENIIELSGHIAKIREDFEHRNISYRSLESDFRYRFIDRLVPQVMKKQRNTEKSPSEKADRILTHPVFGPLILVTVLAFIFNFIFSWAEYPMGWIESAVNLLSAGAETLLPAGALRSLLSDGIIAGVGNVVVFLPQIMLLVFFLGILEDSGYMARMAFMLDRLMGKFGLHGKAVLPMLSGFACAIPAIMSARTIENRRDRLITILLIPLMSCSARLPIYVLLIAAFIPHQTVLGFLQLQSLVFMGIYFLGFFTALAASLMIKKFAGAKKKTHFIMELPTYRRPLFRSVGWKVYTSSKVFLLNAGSIILALSVVLWFLASYPRPAESQNLTGRQKVEQSYAGQIGHFMEPAIRPLGFDWKIGVGLVSSFAAREVIISTFATIYNVQESDGGGEVTLAEAMKKDRDENGRPVFTPLVALSLLVFFVYAAQCMSTFAIIRRETNSWRWPLLMVAYMNVLAYLAALLVYQGGTLLGVA